MLDLIAAYENYLVNVKQASGNTTVSYLRDIRQFAGWLRDAEEAELVDATQQNISDYLHRLATEGRSSATISRSLASLKNFFCLFGICRLPAGKPSSKCACGARGEETAPDFNWA